MTSSVGEGEKGGSGVAGAARTKMTGVEQMNVVAHVKKESLMYFKAKSRTPDTFHQWLLLHIMGIKGQILMSDSKEELTLRNHSQN